MSQEILYTSAPEGLKAGSRGFCTVVSTAGMASNLAERLEGLSGYRHAFDANSGNAGQNPVNFSHAVLTVGGRKYHVLSAVRDAGMDYTQRSNKLADHVALETRECVAGGPAWVLSSPGFCETQWNGQTKLLPAGRTPPLGGREPGICREWELLARDAGWAGVVAETALEKGGRPVSVIYPAGTDVLPLVVECLSLLPPERRWEVTFSTYFTKLPAGVDCQWRFLLEGTPEADQLRRNQHSLVIDLCQPLPPAKGGELVNAARSDRALHARAVSAQAEALVRGATWIPDSLRPRASAASATSTQSTNCPLQSEPPSMIPAIAAAGGPVAPHPERNHPRPGEASPHEGASSFFCGALIVMAGGAHSILRDMTYPIPEVLVGSRQLV